MDLGGERECAHENRFAMVRMGIKESPVNGSLLNTISGGDAFRGNTRPHPEHDG